MKSYFTVLFVLILISCLHLCVALRCQAINQQTNRFEKILKNCKKRNLGHNNYDTDSSSNENNESEDSSDSNENSFDNKFLVKNNSRYYTNNFLNEQNNRNNRAGQSTRNDSPLSFGSNNANDRLKNVEGYYDTNNWGMTNSNWENMKNAGSNHNYQENHNQKQNDSCVIQCFFNELNVVDQRGFPIRESMIRVMTEKIQDPELRDFIEESIIKCFYFLNSANRMEKCEYSQNLITCLIGKGKEILEFAPISSV
ncbi:putative uncharacterized protein DDB_G0286901 isoform X1 [Vespa velutina]|uniref:putative uncharacterized protein DDB_G0286901 isoform X1 n=1 Tax=Vespa velutina TaxID=202808 RepID=UPI001FB1DA6F|nr:putative uncharacterized protein DDB_G0286901 isoform X1 [Vespa velutina]